VLVGLGQCLGELTRAQQPVDFGVFGLLGLGSAGGHQAGDQQAGQDRAERRGGGFREMEHGTSESIRRAGTGGERAPGTENQRPAQAPEGGWIYWRIVSEGYARPAVCRAPPAFP